MLEWVNRELAVKIARASDHVKPDHTLSCLDTEKIELMSLSSNIASRKKAFERKAITTSWT
jgi:hypothetical protein